MACNDQIIKKLNSQFRGNNTSTDVLSWPKKEYFPAKEYPVTSLSKGIHDLGDIAISYETCINQAEKLADQNSKLKIGIEYNKYSYLVDLTNHTKESLYEDVSDSLLSN